MTTTSTRPPMTVKDVRLLIDKSVNAWVDDYAPSMGAALAFYTLFSIAPLFIFIIALAGFIFGADAAQGEIVAQLRGRIGADAAAVVQSLIKSVSRPTRLIVKTLYGLEGRGEVWVRMKRIWTHAQLLCFDMRRRTRSIAAATDITK